MASSYPTYKNGMISQRPYVRIHRFSVSKARSPVGYQYSVYNQDNPDIVWVLSYPVLEDRASTPGDPAGYHEADALKTFFETTVCGRYGEFDFRDPDNNVVYEGCRFDQDEIQFKYAGPGAVATEVRIIKRQA